MNFFSVYNEAVATDKLTLTNLGRFPHYSFFIVINQVMLLFILAYLFTIRDYCDNFWWNHFKLSNLSFALIILLVVVNFFFVYILKVIKYNFNVGKVDYFFALANLSNFLPILFFVNTFFTFLFILEVNSVLVFYKFVTSKVWFSNKNDSDDFSHLTFFRSLPKNYLNMLFFQYWATFFSSVMLMFVIIYFIFIYGTSEWVVLNLLNNIYSSYYSLSTFINSVLICMMFIFAFLIKIGFTPLQLYKIEVYKGLPYISIFFYTTFYFLVFFLFFILFLSIFLNSFILYWWYILVFIIVFGGIYVISLLFDLNYIKAFFAYSTMINSLGFISIILAVLV